MPACLHKDGHARDVLWEAVARECFVWNVLWPGSGLAFLCSDWTWSSADAVPAQSREWRGGDWSGSYLVSSGLNSRFARIRVQRRALQSLSGIYPKACIRMRSEASNTREVIYLQSFNNGF